MELCSCRYRINCTTKLCPYQNNSLTWLCILTKISAKIAQIIEMQFDPDSVMHETELLLVMKNEIFFLNRLTFEQLSFKDVLHSWLFVFLFVAIIQSPKVRSLYYDNQKTAMYNENLIGCQTVFKLLLASFTFVHTVYIILLISLNSNLFLPGKILIVLMLKINIKAQYLVCSGFFYGY